MGSAPGGWSQIISEKIKSDTEKPSVVAVDLLYMDPISGVSFIHGDITEEKVKDKILQRNNFEKFDLVLSDMCPEFKGIKATDHYNLINLNRVCIEFAGKVLKRRGHLIVKTFEGTLQKKLQEEIKKYFNKINVFKPSSSRQESSEVYLICLGYLESEELKKEAEELSKTTPEEFQNKEKDKVIREFKIAKLNKYFLLEELDKMREDIIAKYNIDPEKVKVDEKEEEEMRKILEEEERKEHIELYGHANRLTKANSLFELYDDYRKHFDAHKEKLNELLSKEKIDMTEVEEYLGSDAQMKHLDEITREAAKEYEYLEKTVDSMTNQVEKEEQEEMLSHLGENNEILSKYKSWEKILEEEEESGEINVNEIPRKFKNMDIFESKNYNFNKK